MVARKVMKKSWNDSPNILISYIQTMMLVLFKIISVRVNMCLCFLTIGILNIFSFKFVRSKGKIVWSIIYNSKAITSVEFNYILAHKPKKKKNPSLIRFGVRWGGERNMVVTENSWNINHVFGTQPEQQRQQ